VLGLAIGQRRVYYERAPPHIQPGGHRSTPAIVVMRRWKRVTLLSFFARRRDKRGTALFHRALALLEDTQYDDALAVARKLRKLGHSGAYDIEGRAYSALGRDEDAVRVLREGLQRAPGVWINWSLLGTALSNLGRYDEALLAFERALACQGSDPDVCELNRAIVYIRSGDFDAVLRHLDRVQAYVDDSMRRRAASLRVKALHELGRDDEAKDLGMRTLREWRDVGAPEEEGDIGEIMLILAQIGLARGEDREPWRMTAIESWRATRHKPLLRLIRDLRPERSPHAQYFRLILHGERYITGADVIADSAGEALQLYIDLSGEDVTIESEKLLERRPNEIKGVYSVRSRIYYDERPTVR
jgi:tetratricopeptide (TPR) repeat protein